jgi:hypothetical protein
MDHNMKRINGIPATKIVYILFKIKDLVKTKGYIDCIIIGHSSDDTEDIIKGFLEAGANHFEKKPTSYKKLNDIFNKNEFKDILFKF